LGYLSNLDQLDLSKNKLSGAIPVTLYELQNLLRLNLSYNTLSGRVPYLEYTHHVSLDNNTDFCDDSQYLMYGLMPCEARERQSSKHLSLMLLLAFAPFPLVCLTVASIVVFCPERKAVDTNRKSKPGDMLSIWNFDGKIAFEDILSATENFSEKYCIGIGGYRSVFRVELEGGNIFAVKLLHSMEEFSDEGTFHAEIFDGNLVRGWGAPAMHYRKRENGPVNKGNRT